MELIKKIEKGNFVLTHERFIDAFGFKVDGFDMFDIKNRIHYPFMGMIKAITKKQSETYQSYNNYTEKEYQEMFKEEIDKILKFRKQK